MFMGAAESSPKEVKMQAEFKFEGLKGHVQILPGGGAFVSWGTLGANLSSLRPVRGLADKINEALQRLGSPHRVEARE